MLLWYQLRKWLRKEQLNGGGTMTERHKRFADEYLIDLNATRAYKTVYGDKVSEKAAGSGGWRILKREDVREYIQKQIKDMHDEKIAEAKEVMEYYTAVMRGDYKEQVLRWDGDGTQVVDNIAMPTKERLRASELLGKRYGLFKDKIDIDGAMSISFEGEGCLEE